MLLALVYKIFMNWVLAIVDFLFFFLLFASVLPLQESKNKSLFIVVDDLIDGP